MRYTLLGLVGTGQVWSSSPVSVEDSLMCWNLSTHCQGFPGDSNSRESTCIVGNLGSIPGLGRSPGGGYGNPLQYSCLETPHGQRSLAGYSPLGCKESDTTEWLNTGIIMAFSFPYKSSYGDTKKTPWTECICDLCACVCFTGNYLHNWKTDILSWLKVVWRCPL